MGKIGDTVSSLNGMRRKIQIYVVLFLIILCGVTAIAFNHPAAGGVAAMAAAVYYFAFFRRKIKKFQEEFVRQSLIWSVCSECTEVVYDKNKKLEEPLKNGSLLPTDETSVVKLWHGFTAKTRKHTLAANEMSCNFMVMTSKGKQTKCITGTVVSMDVSGDGALIDDLIIYDRSILYSHIQKIKEKGYEEVTAEGIDGERFILLAPVNAEPSVTDAFCKRFSVLASRIKAPFALELKNGQMTAVLSERFYAPKAAVKNAVAENGLTFNRLPELNSLISFAG